VTVPYRTSVQCYASARECLRDRCSGGRAGWEIRGGLRGGRAGDRGSPCCAEGTGGWGTRPLGVERESEAERITSTPRVSSLAIAVADAGARWMIYLESESIAWLPATRRCGRPQPHGRQPHGCQPPATWPSGCPGRTPPGRSTVLYRPQRRASTPAARRHPPAPITPTPSASPQHTRYESILNPAMVAGQPVSYLPRAKGGGWTVTG
jgi:hypothetical protein